MWETPFEEWMLELRYGVVVLCPTEEAFSEMAKILDKNHIRFGTGSASDYLRFWNSHREDTCYYIKRAITCCMAQQVVLMKENIENTPDAHFTD